MDLLSGAETGAICRLSYGFMSIIRSNQRQVERPPGGTVVKEESSKLKSTLRFAWVVIMKIITYSLRFKKIKCLRFPIWENYNLIFFKVRKLRLTRSQTLRNNHLWIKLECYSHFSPIIKIRKYNISLIYCYRKQKFSRLNISFARTKNPIESSNRGQYY